jgi:ATP-dependent Lhr-like helicase
VAAERLPELRAVHTDAAVHPSIAVPTSRALRSWTREEAIVELLRGRLALAGPTTPAALADSLSITVGDVETGLLTLESEGVVLRGSFSGPGEWCERRLLARIHRYTLNRLRAEIEPVAPADFMRFLFAWQHVDPSHRLTGVDGLRAIVGMLDGFELPARAWERSVLPARMDRYDPAMLDMLCLTGEVAWVRLSTPAEGQRRIGAITSIALVRREHADAWLALRAGDGDTQANDGADALGSVGVEARRVYEVLDTRGASFSRELTDRSGLDAAGLRTALAELVAAGLVTCDGFAGLRALVRTDRSLDLAGRWSILRGERQRPRDAAIEAQAWALLRRYGVVFRRVLVREANASPWRDLARVYRRLEARGEIRGGRFVSGMSGEQFALPDAIERLREIRRTAPGDSNRFVAISAADPLNLTGLVTPGERIKARGSNRIVFGHGVPLAVMEGDYVRPLADIAPDAAGDVATALAGRRVPAVVSGYIGKGA